MYDTINVSLDPLVLDSPGRVLATQSLNDRRIPRVSGNQALKIRLTNPDRRYTYKMRLHRVNTLVNTSAIECPMKIHAVEIDLSEYNSMQFFEPTEVDMATSHLTIGPYMIPHGYIRVSMLFEESGQPVYTCYRYFKVNYHGVSFHEHKLPHSHELSWPLNEDIWVNTSGSFFYSRTKSYGYPSHKDIKYPLRRSWIRSTSVHSKSSPYRSWSRARITILAHNKGKQFKSKPIEFSYGAT
ncbi:hypothetical protein PoB_001600000 [Plakobranchus ocellatus]|uniref:Uncharacterized protein n=1 Tax=Plakobranchus ocellatus TaxID=259542 RepID=A0AAV3Z272_9GAST|nr:hypothetical protein PoB_001600000 [Plakobranchus ocellatus]